MHSPEHINMNSKDGLTCIITRQTSQGNQRVYNATGMDTQQEMSVNMVSTYESQQVGAVIREVSQSY
jgi:hypothetical protein